MAILSLDTYLQHEIGADLKGLLSDSYIIREVILKDFDDSVVNPFINTFCTSDDNQGTEIPLLFTFPKSKQPAPAFIVIQSKGATEYDQGRNALGGIMAVGDTASGNLRKEKLTCHVEYKNGFPFAYFKTAYPISEFNGFDTYSGKYQIDDDHQTIHVPFLEGLHEGFEATATYSPQEVDKAGKAQASDYGLMRGYDLMENYTVDSVSNNMDTLRCLEAFLKTILIYMKSNIEEQTEYRLSKAQFQSVDLINMANNPQNSLYGEQLFYRRLELSYDVTYSITDTIGTRLKKLRIDIEGGKDNS